VFGIRKKRKGYTMEEWKGEKRREKGRMKGVFI
jgi:hypothetical protein